MSDESEVKIRAMASETLVMAARDLRLHETSAEERLWACLRDRRLTSLKFRRQHPIATTPFIADFLCYEAMLIIELDGGIHLNQAEQDKDRQDLLEEAGYRVIRFANERIFSDLSNVLTEIISAARPSSMG